MTIANQFNISSSAVGNRRRKLNIPFYVEDINHYFTEEVISLLGNKSDPHISEKYGMSSCTASRKRKSVLKEKEKRYNE